MRCFTYILDVSAYIRPRRVNAGMLLYVLYDTLLFV